MNPSRSWVHEYINLFPNRLLEIHYLQIIMTKIIHPISLAKIVVTFCRLWWLISVEVLHICRLEIGRLYRESLWILCDFIFSWSPPNIAGGSRVENYHRFLRWCPNKTENENRRTRKRIETILLEKGYAYFIWERCFYESL